MQGSSELFYDRKYEQHGITVLIYAPINTYNSNKHCLMVMQNNGPNGVYFILGQYRHYARRGWQPILMFPEGGLLALHLSAVF